MSVLYLGAGRQFIALLFSRDATRLRIKTKQCVCVCVYLLEEDEMRVSSNRDMEPPGGVLVAVPYRID